MTEANPQQPPEDRCVVSRPIVNIFTMQVCAVSDATDEEILECCNALNPAGTQHGWSQVIRDDKEAKQRNPVPCATYQGRTHFLVTC